MKISTLGALLVLSSALAFADNNPLPSPELTDKRILPDDASLTKDSAYQKLYKSESEKSEELQKQLLAIRKKIADGVPEEVKKSPPKKRIKKKSIVRAATDVLKPENDQNSVMQGTPITIIADAPLLDTVLPAGSYVKAKVLSGVEANTMEPYPLLLELDYAFSGPNKTKLDLKNCLMIAKARANLSTERVNAEVSSLSCVRSNGENIERPVRGYLAGEDSTFGVTGQLISKQGQVLLAAVLANLAKGAGEAVAMAQTTTQVAASSSSTEKATNLTGKALPFIVGKGTADASAMIAQWYLDYARQLVPSIAVGSGRDVWVVMLETTKIPPLK